MNGSPGGETPFSEFADVETLSSLTNEPPKSASPGTVTNLIVLPSHANKKALKSYLREKLFSPNHDIRSVLYKRLVRRIECSEQMFSRDMYEQFVAEQPTTSAPPSVSKSVSHGADILPLCCLNRKGQKALDLILACVHQHFPHITYSPLLSVATLMLLLYDDDPAQVFTHVCRLIFANSRHCQYLDITDEDNVASAQVLRQLSQRYAAGSHKSLLNLTTNPDEVYAQWLRCLFRGLPFSFVVVLFDMYLLEGYKALYRVSLAILRFYRKSGVSNADNIMDTVFEFVRGIESSVQRSSFFKKAFNLKLPASKEIFKLHRAIMCDMKTVLVSTQQQRCKPKQKRTPFNYLHTIKNLQSEIVDEKLMSRIYCCIPERFAQHKPHLVFSTNINGFSIGRFFSCVEEFAPTLLLIKATADSRVIGAYCSDAWIKRRSESGYFGTGETCLFTLLPEFKCYPWVMLNKEQTPSPPSHDNNPPATNSTFSLPPIHNASSTHQSLASTPAAAAVVNDPPLVLPPLVQSSNHSLALSRGSSANSSSEHLSTTRSCTLDNSSSPPAGTFEDVPHENHDDDEQVLPVAAAKKESISQLVEEGYTPARRCSQLPEESPLTSAIENIFVDPKARKTSSFTTAEQGGSPSTTTATAESSHSVPMMSAAATTDTDDDSPSSNDLFMMANTCGLMIGGGGGGHGIFIDFNLNHGTTEWCSTFNNQPLIAERNFVCSSIEVFSFGSTLVDC